MSNATNHNRFIIPVSPPPGMGRESASLQASIWISRICRNACESVTPATLPVIPAQAGIQGNTVQTKQVALDSCIRWNNAPGKPEPAR